MNFPKLALNTFLRLKDQPEFQSLWKALAKRLRKLNSGVRKARFIHKEIDQVLKEQIEGDSFVKSSISCKKGCYFCCYSHIAITEAEAELLAKKIIQGHEIDLERLHVQANAENDEEKWNSLTLESKRCVFLDESNSCSIYEDRPSVCRTNYVISDPRICHPEYPGKANFRMLKTEKADFMAMALFTQSKENGTLPYMVWKTLKRLLKSDATKSTDERA